MTKPTSNEDPAVKWAPIVRYSLMAYMPGTMREIAQKAGRSDAAISSLLSCLASGGLAVNSKPRSTFGIWSVTRRGEQMMRRYEDKIAAQIARNSGPTSEEIGRRLQELPIYTPRQHPAHFYATFNPQHQEGMP